MKLLGDIGGTLVNFLSSKDALEAISYVWPNNDSFKNIPIKFLIESTANLLGAAAFGFDEN
ncbi:MAG: hypothetical protein VX006_03420 [Pseudomonadota bacterium]|nr:hypothetical protein [Pseudomonadota bacterium]